MPKKTKTTDQATAQISEPTGSPTEMVTAGNKHIPGIKNSANYANASEVQATTTAWEVENKNLADANQKVIDADLAAEQARADQASAARRWKGRAHACVAAINVFADGSKDVVTSFAMAVVGRNDPALALVPEDLHGVRSKIVGTATAKWKTVRGNYGYMVQYTMNPADPSTYSAPVHSSAGTFELSGQTPGATVYFRVAACDSRLPGHQTAYTAWVAVTVSA